MTILGPVLMAAVFIIPMVLAMNAEETSNIAIVDETGLFATKFNTTESLTFSVLSVPIEEAKTTFVNNGYDDLLYIPKTEVVLPTSAVIFSENQVSITTKTFIRNVMRDEVEEQKMLASGIDPEILKSIKTSISLTSFILDSSGEEKESYAEVAMAVGYVGGLLIYMFIFIYGSMVMRGVIEEKTSRIIEIIISSVKPFQLMMGKIIGIALVGLTQFLLWIVLTAGIVGIFNGFFAEKMIDKRVPEITQSAGGLITENTLSSEAPEAEEVINEGFVEILEMIRTINIPVMLISFIFYFLGGYLLYASMFAAIGAAVDNETDTQQFMLPITVPIILALVMMPSVIENPSGSLAIWLSMIPFTSPISMMMRIPFGVPYIELVISAIILVFTFVGMTWAAGKIYRTGILMYGKKVSYKELWKWIRYNG